MSNSANVANWSLISWIYLYTTNNGNGYVFIQPATISLFIVNENKTFNWVARSWGLGWNNTRQHIVEALISLWLLYEFHALKIQLRFENLFVVSQVCSMFSSQPPVLIARSICLSPLGNVSLVIYSSIIIHNEPKSLTCCVYCFSIYILNKKRQYFVSSVFL
jgi:hypothetical protein